MHKPLGGFGIIPTPDFFASWSWVSMARRRILFSRSPTSVITSIVAVLDEGKPWIRAVDETRIRALWPELLEAAGLL
jgi:hypothetical protein